MRTRAPKSSRSAPRAVRRRALRHRARRPSSKAFEILRELEAAVAALHRGLPASAKRRVAWR